MSKTSTAATVRALLRDFEVPTSRRSPGRPRCYMRVEEVAGGVLLTWFDPNVRCPNCGASGSGSVEVHLLNGVWEADDCCAVCGSAAVDTPYLIVEDGQPEDEVRDEIEELLGDARVREASPAFVD